MKRTNNNRKEAYNFYRSIINPKTHKNYTPDEARNMRNRGSARVIIDYTKHRKQANKEYDDGELEKRIKIHRPKMIGTQKEKTIFKRKISKHVDAKITKYMVNDNAINQNLYLKRMPKLKSFFESKGLSWDQFLKDAEHFDSLGDWLDYLGERYQDENTT